MSPFTFAFPGAELHHGTDSAARLPAIVERLGARRPLVVAGPHVSANPAVQTALAGLSAEWFTGVRPYMPVPAVAEGVARARDTGADLLVAVGGGSALDTAKSMAAVLATDLDVESYAGKYRVVVGDDGIHIPPLPGPIPPIVAIPTTLSGAELNGATSVMVHSGHRWRLRSLDLTPRAIVYDARLAVTTPRSVLRATGFNALDHGVEIYYAKGHHVVIDALALASVRLLAAHLPALAESTVDLDALGQLQLGGALAGAWMNSILILEQRGHGLNHALGHILGSRYGMSQGDAHAVVMPHGMRFVAQRVPRRMADLAEALGAPRGSGVDGAVAEVVRIRAALGLPDRLGPFVGAAEPEEIAEHVMGDFSVRSCSREVDVTGLTHLLRDAW